MDELNLETGNFRELFQNFSNKLGGNLSFKDSEYDLVINNTKAKGKIRGLPYEDGFGFLEFDLTLPENLILISKITESHPVFFSYCALGELVHKFQGFQNYSTIHRFQTCIVANSSSDVSTFLIRKNLRVHAAIIIVYDAKLLKDTTNEDSLSPRILNTFKPSHQKTTFSYIGSYNLKIASKINALNAIEQKGLVRLLLVKSIVNMILSLEIEQYNSDKSRASSGLDLLSPEELEEIHEISLFIKNYPETNLGVNKLCSKTGLPAAKLQEGFKVLHGTTVSNFIRMVRLDKAEELMKKTNLNVSEIMYSVGLSSRSYFSKIFKERFKCSPKSYQTNQRLEQLNA